MADTLDSNLELSVTRTWGNRTLPVKSPEWRVLRAQIISDKKGTCASCGYKSPHSSGRGLKIDHKDGNASNNSLDNLRIHCPPCEAIRHCGFAGMNGWVILGHSDMEQVDILRRTRELFELNWSIPHVQEVDPNATCSSMKTTTLASKLLSVDRGDLTGEERHLKGFFTENAMDLFTVTMPVRPGYVPCYFTSIALLKWSTSRPGSSGADASQAIMTRSESWVVFSPRKHSNIQTFFRTWPPSMTHTSQVAWICVQNSKYHPTDHCPDLDGLQHAWAAVSNNKQHTADSLADLARQFNVLEGKWMIFSRSDKIDSVWSRIANATHAGNLGISSKVSPRDDNVSSHVICVHTRDFTDRSDVDRVRDGLRRLGMKGKIGYKPDIYTYCDIYKGNFWNIRPSLYFS